MITKIWIIRHAISIANDNGMFGNITDYDSIWKNKEKLGHIGNNSVIKSY